MNVTGEMVTAAMDAYAVGLERFPDCMRRALEAALSPVTGAVDDAAEWRIWADEGELAFEAQGRAIVSIADDHVSYAVRHGEGGWEPGSFDPMAEPEKACAEILAALPTPSLPKGGDRP